MNHQSRTPQRRPARQQPQRQQEARVASRPYPKSDPLVISEEEAQAIRDAEGYEMQAITGYDPVAQATSATQGTAITPAGQRSGVARTPARRLPAPPPPQDEEEFDDEGDLDNLDEEYEDDGDEYGDDERLRAIEEENEMFRQQSRLEAAEDRNAREFYADAEDEAGAIEESSALFDDMPPPPPSAEPVKYSGWLDLGDQADPKYAIPYRGWKIKIRLDVSMGMLSAVEQLQDAKVRADEWKRRTGRTINTVRIEHIRTILEDIVVAWNYVDEFRHPRPQPPAGLRYLRPDLLAATLNRAMMEFSPSKKRSTRSTKR